MLSFLISAGACHERSKITGSPQTAHQQQQAPAEGVPVAQKLGRWSLPIHTENGAHRLFCGQQR